MEIEEEAAAAEFEDKSADRIKFLYSYGGKIVPRRADWKLRYAGGETRVAAFDRNITFADLMAKLTEVIGSNPVLKCQLPNQDLDALVSITSDEDLQIILDEYNRQRIKQNFSKVRAFLFFRTGSPLKFPAAARTCCGHTIPSARSDGLCNLAATYASKTIPRQHNSVDRALSSAYVVCQHCLR